jgi:polyisoprenoid-binding protein YceI
LPKPLAVQLRSPEIPDPGTYRLVPDTCVAEFAVRHMVVSTARGRLAAVAGQLVIDTDDALASWVRIDLDATSFASGSAERDAAFRGPDLLAADEYPITRFESTYVEEAGPGRFKVFGDLYIRDVVGEVVIDARLIGLGARVAFAGTTSFSRSAFGLTWGAAIEKIGITVADVVRITVAAQFIPEVQS